MTFSSPPQFGPRTRSSSKARWRHLDQPRRTGRCHRDPGTSTVNGSVHFYVDVVDAGAYIQAASGHNDSLSAPVPEPTTWVLMLAGMARLGKVRNASSRS